MSSDFLSFGECAEQLNSHRQNNLLLTKDKRTFQNETETRLGIISSR